MRLDCYGYQVFIAQPGGVVDEGTRAHNYLVLASSIEEAMQAAVIADEARAALINDDQYELRADLAQKKQERVVIRVERMMGNFQAVIP